MHLTSDYVRPARDVAARLGWNLTTVYVNRRRTLMKLDAGLALRPNDLPAGVRTHDGLRWSDAELDRFQVAAESSKRRGGRNRPPRSTTPTPERQQREMNGQ